MKVAVIGARGQLGSALMKTLGDRGVPICHSHHDPNRAVNVQDKPKLLKVISEYLPIDWIINCAASHSVDKIEGNPTDAFIVNALGALSVARVAEKIDAGVVYISTDYVFGHNGPWSESAKPQPLSVYGVSKLAGEHLTMAYAHKWLIVRTATLFGGPNSFVETMLRLGKAHDTLTVTDDLIISPSYALDVADKIVQLCAEHPWQGHCHITNKGCCTYKEFAEEIFRQQGLPITVLPGKASDRDVAVRPRNSVLEHGFLNWYNIDDMRSWQDALSEYLMEASNA